MKIYQIPNVPQAKDPMLVPVAHHSNVRWRRHLETIILQLLDLAKVTSRACEINGSIWT